MILLGTIASSLLQNIDKGVMYPLQVITVGPTSVSSITFSNIPSTYNHLHIRGIIKGSANNLGDNVNLIINNDTGSNYSSHLMLGNGSVSETGSQSSATSIPFTESTNSFSSATNMFSTFVGDILDYSSTSKFKTTRCFTGNDRNGDGRVMIRSGLWRNTNAITSLQFSLATGGTNFIQNTQIAIYGVKGK